MTHTVASQNSVTNGNIYKAIHLRGFVTLNMTKPSSKVDDDDHIVLGLHSCNTDQIS